MPHNHAIELVEQNLRRAVTASARRYKHRNKKDNQQIYWCRKG